MAKQPEGLSLKELLESQQRSNATVSSHVAKQLKALEEQEQSIKKLNDNATAKTGDGLNSNVIKMVEEIKKSNKLLKKQYDAQAVLGKVGDRREFKTIGQRVGGIKDNVKDFFTMRGFLDKTGIVERGTGGIFSEALDAREDRQKYAKERIAAGDPTVNLFGKKKSQEIFERQRGEQQQLVRDKNKTEGKIAEYRRLNLSESQIAKSPEAAMLKEIAKKFEKVDPSVRVKTEEYEEQETERHEEVISRSDEQSDLLSQIEQNTRDRGQAGPTVQAAENSTPAQRARRQTAPNAPETKSAGGGGWDRFLGGVTKGIATLTNALKSIGRGFGDAVGGFFEGILTGIANGLKQLANPKVFLGVAAMLGIAGAVWVVSDAFQKFSSVSWEDVLKGFAALTGLGVLAAVAAAAAPALLIGAGVIAVLGAALIPFAFAMDLAGGAMEKFATAMERLSGIDSMKLAKLGPALAAVSAGLMAFAAANVVAGLSTLVTNLLTLGQDSPIEQLEKISTYGPGLQKAGTGISSVAAGMKEFNKVDDDTMDVVNDFPWVKATLFAATGGQMKAFAPDGSGVAVGAPLEQSPAAKQIAPKLEPVVPSDADNIYGKSAEVKGREMQQGNSGNTAMINAPTTINRTSQTSVVKPTSRNSESAVSRFISTRYTPHPV